MQTFRKKKNLTTKERTVKKTAGIEKISQSKILKSKGISIN